MTVTVDSQSLERSSVIHGSQILCLGNKARAGRVFGVLAQFSANWGRSVASRGWQTEQGILMYNVETIQQHLKVIATAHTDFAKTSFEQGKIYVEQLTQVKSPA